MDKHVYYKKGFKYQTVNDFKCQVEIYPSSDIVTDFICLSKDGFLFLKKGYAWDGPSGPTVDTKNFMRGSLVHDALYQLMRMELLPQSAKEQADIELKKICKDDGMSSFRAFYVHKSVEHFGHGSTDPDNKKEIIKAP